MTNGEEKEKLKERLKKKSIDYFGLTEDCSKGGFILEDGKMLDFSNRFYTGEKGSFKRLEHDTIGFVDPPNTKTGITGIAKYIEDTGSIRFINNRHLNYIEIPEGITKKQYDKMEDCICMNKPKHFAVDKTEEVQPSVMQTHGEDFDSSGDCVEDFKELKKQIAKIERRKKDPKVAKK